MRKIGLPVILLFLFVASSYALGVRLFAQHQYSRAAELIRQGRYESAVARLNTAIRYQKSASRNWKALGNTYLLLSTEKPYTEAYAIVSKAKKAYLTASKLNPNDSDIFFGLSKAEDRLEFLYYLSHSGKNPHDPTVYLEKAITLFPNNIMYHLYLVEYFFRKNEQKALSNTVSKMAYISPKAYYLLKKKSFWNLELKESFLSGLNRAIQDKKKKDAAQKMITLLKKEQSH